jgi:hypothetical protein
VRAGFTKMGCGDLISTILNAVFAIIGDHAIVKRGEERLNTFVILSNAT